MKYEWIDVKKELPEEKHKCRGHGLCNLLVVVKYIGFTRVEQCLYTKEKGFKAINGGRKLNNDDVTFWMYLPEPPIS